MTAGAFMQRQSHGIRQQYQVANWFDPFEVPGNVDTIWLTDQEREDDDDAVFGELTFDITEKVVGDRRHSLLRNREFAEGILRLTARCSAA